MDDVPCVRTALVCCLVGSTSTLLVPRPWKLGCGWPLSLGSSWGLGISRSPRPSEEVAWYRSCLGKRQMMRRVALYPRLGGAEKQTKILRSSSNKSGALLPRSYAPHLEGLVLGSTVAWRIFHFLIFFLLFSSKVSLCPS